MEDQDLASKIIYKVFVANWKKVVKIFHLGRLHIIGSNFNIGISLEHVDENILVTYRTELIKRLNDSLNKFGLSQQIKINDLSEIKTFKSNKEAESFSSDSNIDLLIWGRLSSSKLKKDKEKVVNPIFYFTYNYQSDKHGKIKDSFEKELGTLLSTKPFVKEILEKDSLIAIENININMFEVSTYILGIILKLSGELDKSMEIFESLLENVPHKNDYFTNGIKFHLVNIYTLKLLSFTWADKGFEDSLLIADKLLHIDGDNIEGITAKAYALFKLGRIPESNTLVSMLKNKYPTADVTKVDSAFFYILERNYKKAFFEYKKLENITEPQIIVAQVIDFLDRMYDLHDDEPAFLFGSAFLNYLFFDKLRAIELFKKFVSEANDYDYQQMYRYSKKIIKERTI